VDKLKVQLGAAIILVGFGAILVALWIVTGKFADAKDVGSVLAPITTTIAALGGAFFGVSLGQQGKEKAEQGREKAEDDRSKAQQRAEMYLARLPPDVAQEVQQQVQF
jgi:mRNA-degrading endonuclease toxin of MazEF toxin-antitoxin module